MSVPRPHRGDATDLRLLPTAGAGYSTEAPGTRWACRSGQRARGAEQDLGTERAAMGPTARDWLGAGALVLVLAVLVVLLAIASLPSDGASAVVLHVLA